ncbi:MAG: cytochrome c oxidase assembly protein [Actinomycetota bacterium]|nr:cytochrome c oxidase assembly protein [Actinomycetota bacterium]
MLLLAAPPPLTGALPRLAGHTLVSQWSFHAGWTVAGVVLISGYLVALRMAARRGLRPVSPIRVACFVTGTVLLVATVSSAMGGYAMSVFWVHMIEHLTLIMVVPVLLVLGHPLTVIRDGLAGAGRTRFEAALHSAPVSVLTYPLTGLLLYSAVIVGTHLTSFMDTMAMHPWLMTGEQVLYVVSGWLLFATLVGSEPIRWRVPYLLRIVLLLLAMVPDTLVGIVLVQSNRVLFPMMMGMHPAWAPNALRDQQISGSLMWAVGDGLMVGVAFGVVVALISGSATRSPVLGGWLESARRQTLTTHLALSGAEPANPAEGQVVDVDDDDDLLAAYNQMLARMNKHR